MTKPVVMRETAIYDTPVGAIVHHWTDCGLYELRFARDKATLARTDIQPGSASRQLNDLLDQYFQGAEVSFADVPIDLSGWTDFFASIYQECQQISFGETMTYGELAAQAGRPNAARAVGSAMARNRIALVVPCHRVLGGTGNLTGFSAPGGVETKQYLLDLESGVGEPSLLFT